MKQKPFWLQQEDFRWIALVWGAAFLIVAVIEAIVSPLLSEDGALIPMASLFGLTAGPLLMAVFGVVRFTTEFGIGLQMGATRRQMVAAELWLCLCQNVEMLALELLTVLLESTLLPLLRGVPAYLTPEDHVAIAAALPGWLIPALFFGLLAAGRGGEKDAPIPWGPSIALGAWVTALVGEPLICSSACWPQSFWAAQWPTASGRRACGWSGRSASVFNGSCRLFSGCGPAWAWPWCGAALHCWPWAFLPRPTACCTAVRPRFEPDFIE